MTIRNFDGWIELDAYCEKYGERKNTVHKRVADGTWERGVIYASPSGSVTYVHEERAKEWLAARPPKGEGVQG
jgi:hypothetical protein